MAQPTAYNRLVNFLQYAAAHTSATYNAADHDSELNAIETTLGGILTNLALIQRDDGYLKNASVHADAFSTATLALIASDWTPRGLWVTATAYVVGDVVQNSTSSYVCATAHTSGTFNTDYTAGKWVILGATAGTAASAIAASAYGHIAATNVQAFLEELVDEKARLAGSTSQTFDVADATDDTHAVAGGQVQKDSLIYCGAAGGSSDALTGTLTSGLTTLTGGQRARVKATAANGTTAPTFNLTLGSTATGAKTIKKGAAAALIIGDIAGSGHVLDLVYESSADCWLLLNPAYPPGQSTDAVDADSNRNIGISFSTGSSALTASLKSASGGTPSASDAVAVAQRNSSASTGTYSKRTVESSLTITAPSGATFGHTSGVAGRLHWYLLDNSGTQELAVAGKFFGHSGIVSTTAISASSTNGNVMYSTSARSSLPFRWIATTVDTQATAGTWASNPTTVDLVRPTQVDTAQALGKAIYGLTYSNNGSDATNDIDIAAGGAMDATGEYFMRLTATITKQLDAAWAVGNNAGGLDTGSIGNSDYYIWLIARSDTGVVDVLYSLSSTAPTMPSNYDYKRLIGWFKRVGGTIVAFTTYETEGGGIELSWNAPTLDVNLANTLTTSRRTDALKVPLNFSVLSHANYDIYDATTGTNQAWICCPDQTDAAPGGGAAPEANLAQVSTAQRGYAALWIRTSATGTVASRSSLATVDSYTVSTMGFRWARRN